VKKLLLLFVFLIGWSSVSSAIPIPGRRVVIKEQVQQLITTTAADITRAQFGYVAIMTPSTILANAAQATDNFFTVLAPGIDLEAFYDSTHPIYLKTSSGTVTVNALIYDYE